MDRISTSYQFGSYSQNIARAQQRYLEVQNQIGSGKRLLQPSDDPAGIARSVSLRALQSAAERYSQNLAHGKSLLSFSESALGEMTQLFRRAYQLAVNGANAATDQAGREAMVREIGEIQRRLVDLGNTRGPGNQYLFAGQQVDVKPFTQNAGSITYNGDANFQLVESAPGEALAASVNLGQTLVDAYADLETLKNDLQSGNPGAISGVGIPAMQDAMNALTAERGTIGGRLQQIDQLQSDYRRRSDEFTAAISEVEDVDMAEAITRYQLAETAYTAALQVAGQGFRMSLLDFIQG